jgi:GT2 family glycosyltransferase
MGLKPTVDSKPAVKVLFASGSDDLIPTAVEHMRELFPDLPLVVVSEFPPNEECRWIPYHVRRRFRDNLALCRASLRGQRIRLAAVILQPRMPYWRMRALALVLAPWNFLAFNENFGHFMLRPRSAGVMLRHFLWRTRNFLVWEFSPGGAIYTFLWRLVHPWAFRRPLLAWAAQLASFLRRNRQVAEPASLTPSIRPSGISVVIPSRNGRELLARGLPSVLRELSGLPDGVGRELIVVDNGSDDDTGAFLRAEYPQAALAESADPLSFARAANAGITSARYSHICLLNNDMVVEDHFFNALWTAFQKVPNLFCATAQIFFPHGARREETGKAVMPPPETRRIDDFPVRCDLPIEGEDLSYVLYGSGGCSLFHAAKLQHLCGFDTAYEPAYCEDLDLGVRSWQNGWPTVFVASARVEHRHRATTSRYYSAEQLEEILERNYLHFVANTLTDTRVFREMWRAAVVRLNTLAARQTAPPAAIKALAEAPRIAWHARRRSPGALPDPHVFAIGSGAVAVFPGRNRWNKPVVLIASPYLPFPLAHGGAVRMANLMRRAARDFDQILISFVDELKPVPPELLDICVEVVTVKRLGSHARPLTGRPDVVEEFDSPAFHAALRETVRKWKPAVVQLEFTQMAQYAGDCAPAKTLLIEHDITLDLQQQLLEQGEDWELRQQLERWIPFETAAWRAVDLVVTMSEKDRRMVEGGSAVALPNGVDIERFQPASAESEPGRLLFIGSFGHFPNVMALEFFLREVWPHLAGRQLTLHVIAGARHQYFLDRYRDRVRLDLEQPGLEVEDFVADVRPAYRHARIVVAPLLASAGTNIKIMEAMAMGKAVVSTPAGINGLDLTPGRDLLVAETGEAMARAIDELLRDRERSRAIEWQARQTVARQFDWNVIAAKQRQIYEGLGARVPG